MYAIEEGAQRINDGTVLTFSRKVVEHNTLLKVEAGTTGYSGGDSRLAGGRTYISITCDAGDFHFGLARDEKDRTRWHQNRLLRRRRTERDHEDAGVSPTKPSTTSGVMWMTEREKRQAGMFPVCLVEVI